MQAEGEQPAIEIHDHLGMRWRVHPGGKAVQSAFDSAFEYLRTILYQVCHTPVMG